MTVSTTTNGKGCQRKLDACSPQYINCFDVDEITDYISGDIDIETRKSIFNHLNIEKCGYCRNLYSEVKSGSNSSEDLLSDEEDFEIDFEILSEIFKENLRENPPKNGRKLDLSKIQTGQVWTTSQKIKNQNGEIVDYARYAYPVLITDIGENGIIRVAPISVDTDFVWNGHSIRIGKRCLGYEVIIEAFNERPMLTLNLNEFIDRLTIDEFKSYCDCRNNFLSGRSLPLPDDIARWEEKELSLTGYLSDPVSDDDDDELWDEWEDEWDA